MMYLPLHLDIAAAQDRIATFRIFPFWGAEAWKLGGSLLDSSGHRLNTFAFKMSVKFGSSFIDVGRLPNKVISCEIESSKQKDRGAVGCCHS